MSEISNKILSEIGCSFLSGFAFKSSDYVNKGIPLIKIGNIQNRVVTIDTNGNYVPEELVNFQTQRYLLTNDDLLIAMTGQGSVGRVGKLKLRKGDKAFLNQRVGKFICDEVHLNKDYLYYILTTDKFQDYLFNTGAGSGQPNLSPDLILQTEIPWIEYSEQTAIASILSSLDDKIDLLHRQNATLEKMAETLFRQWFVEEAKEEWEMGSIYELVEIVYGFPFKSKYFNSEKKGLPLIRIRDLKDGQSNVYTEEVCDLKFNLENGDLVAGMDGEFRLYIWSGIRSALNQRVCKFVPKHKYVPDFFIFSLMKPYLHYYENTKVGTTVIHLGKADFDDIKISIPPITLLVKFGEETNEWFSKVKNNNNQIRTLTALRDTLLPKLMSGEVKVEC